MIYECYACGRKYKNEPQYCQCGSFQFKKIDNKISNKTKRG